jgi:hypothetical protein
VKVRFVVQAGVVGLLAAGVFAQEGGAGAAPAQSPAPGGAQGVSAFAAMREAMSFEKMDANKDGKVTSEEYLAASAEVARARFKMIDTNNDGALSKEELDKSRESRRGGSRGQGGEGRAPKAPDAAAPGGVR